MESLSEKERLENEILKAEQRMENIKKFEFIPEKSKIIGNIVFCEDTVETDTETLEVFSGFHAERIIERTEPDGYFAWIRANHFAIEIGWSEFSDSELIIIVTANHKGTRISTLWKTSL